MSSGISGFLNQLGQFAGSAVQTISNLLTTTGGLQPLQLEQPPDGDKLNAEEIIGLPPSMYYNARDQSLALRSMPVVFLSPGWPRFDGGLNLYAFDAAKGAQKFNDMLGPLGVDMPSYPIKVAFSNDGNISESFQSAYSQSAMEDMVQSFSNQIGADARYMTGASDIQGILGGLSGGAANSLRNNGGAFGGARNGAADAMGGLGKMIAAGGGMIDNAAGNVGGKFGTALKQVMIGSRVDFPMIWRHSSYAPSYQLTVRLYNPYPADNDMYEKHIIKPLTYLLGFMTPLSDSDYTFEHPVLCQAICPGLFSVRAGYIESMTIIKGGGAADISYYQRPGTVEVQFTIADVYSTMIAKTTAAVNEDRPTLDRYVQTLRGGITIPDIDLSADIPGTGPNVSPTPNISPATMALSEITQYLLQNPGLTSARNTVSDIISASNPLLVGNQIQSLLSGTTLNINDASSITQIAQEEQLGALIKIYSSTTSNYGITPIGTIFGPQHIVALQIKLGIKVAQSVLDWYYSNYNELNINGSLDQIASDPNILATPGGALISTENF